MCIRTTISIRLRLAQKLAQSSNAACVRAIERAIKKNGAVQRRGAVRYQSSGEGYCRIHIVVTQELYEILCGIRWNGKVSVSLIISEALEEILSEKEPSEKRMLDSYPLFIVELQETEIEIVKTIRVRVSGLP